MSFPQISSNLLSAIPVVVNLSWAETEVFKIYLVIYNVCVCVCVCMFVCVHSRSHPTFAAPWTVAHHATFHSSANRIFQGRILSYLF